MGLSIHYSGYLKGADLLPELIREVQDISEIYGWKYQILDSVFPNEHFNEKADFENLYGINFTPTNCETISIVFLSNGRMACPARVLLADKTELQDEDSWIYFNSVKTQFAGFRIHQLIIHLFKYLNEKYFRNFKMNDESYYWETMDEAKMKNQFKVYNTLLENFELAIETFPMQSDEGIEQYFKRVIKHVQSLRNRH